jgi:hypothetical protein
MSIEATAQLAQFRRWTTYTGVHPDDAEEHPRRAEAHGIHQVQ